MLSRSYILTSLTRQMYLFYVPLNTTLAYSSPTFQLMYPPSWAPISSAVKVNLTGQPLVKLVWIRFSISCTGDLLVFLIMFRVPYPKGKNGTLLLTLLSVCHQQSRYYNINIVGNGVRMQITSPFLACGCCWLYWNYWIVFLLRHHRENYGLLHLPKIIIMN